MNQLLKILFLLSMFKVGIACGKDIPKVVKPNEFSVLDEYARKTPQQYEVGLTTLASYLIKPAKTDLEKARVLFTWVATHVRYDDAAYNSGNYPDYTAEFVLKNKRAVCEGYSNVLMALCDEAGNWLVQKSSTPSGLMLIHMHLSSLIFLKSLVGN